ncbi:hypothetical protein ACUJ46_09850 [Sandaracinobacteroides sp. A072]|uniref:hypothetical protein n=1 Tax=Sandaracinobacteroides sp. A072 TaxID=3461146 RepID=UPI00404370D7
MLARGLLALLAAALVPAASTAGPEGLTDDRNARDLTLATEWFEGEFNNDLQVWFETDPRSKIPAQARRGRVHRIHSRLPEGVLGGSAFLVREYPDDDRAQPPTAYVVLFESMKPAEGIAVRHFRLNGAADPAVIRATMLAPEPACDIVLYNRGAQLEGTAPGACGTATGVQADKQMWLGPETYLRERTTGKAELTPTAFYKARTFTCTANMFADSYLRPSKADKAYVFENRHDLGDVMDLDSPRDGKRYQLQLRRQRYPYYQRDGEFLLLRLREAGAASSVALVTSDTDNNSISLNLGWAMINCNSRPA